MPFCRLLGQCCKIHTWNKKKKRHVSLREREFWMKFYYYIYIEYYIYIKYIINIKKTNFIWKIFFTCKLILIRILNDFFVSTDSKVRNFIINRKEV